MEKKVPLYFKVVGLRPDPVQFKPNATDYEPEIATFVCVDVPAKHILVASKARTVLSSEGVAFVLRELGRISLLVTNN